MVPHYPGSFTGNDAQHPCSGTFLGVASEWFALYNPPIQLSRQDPAISQSFDASEAVLSPLAFGNGPSDAYLLESMPPLCSLSSQHTSAYIQVGQTWYRHDRRLELTNCSGSCELQGHVKHAYTLTNQSFSGIDKTVSEVANEPALGHRFNVWLISEAGFRLYMPFVHDRDSAKMMAWTTTVMHAADQLRHRVAFALAQILVIGESGFNKAEEYEVYASYYDIFVRNAFASYYDVLREVTYSAQMATYLSFHKNRAFASRGTTPDENFAREIMQLFTIGLYMLRDDGTLEVDAAGAAISSYDNSDIMSFARVWTGFTRSDTRPNVMRGKADYRLNNFIDGNTVTVEDRDIFPKVNLYDQYLGDGFPLCPDLPSNGFLRAGARYRRTFTFDGEKRTAWFPFANAPSITLGSNSSLARALCGQPGLQPLYGVGVNSSSGCPFLDEVVLSSDLLCDGDECLVSSDAYVVQLAVGSPSSNVSILYEYVRPVRRARLDPSTTSFALLFLCHR